MVVLMHAALLVVRATAVFVCCGALVATVVAQRSDAPAPRVVRITAERFAFTPSEVTVEPGTTIEFVLTSDDTSHGFRIVGQSVDVAIPKRGRGEARLRFTPPAAGVYVFECSRMCGAGHSFMRGSIIVKAAPDKERR
jgi:cytochrome c oxidase subunit II